MKHHDHGFIRILPAEPEDVQPINKLQERAAQVPLPVEAASESKASLHGESIGITRPGWRGLRLIREGLPAFLLFFSGFELLGIVGQVISK